MDRKYGTICSTWKVADNYFGPLQVLEKMLHVGRSPGPHTDTHTQTHKHAVKARPKMKVGKRCHSEKPGKPLATEQVNV